MMSIRRRFIGAVGAGLAVALVFTVLRFPTQARLEHDFVGRMAAESATADATADDAFARGGSFERWIRARESDDADRLAQAQAAVTKANLNADAAALTRAQGSVESLRDRHQRWERDYDDFRAQLLRLHDAQAHFLLEVFLLFWALPVAVAYLVIRVTSLGRPQPTRADGIEDDAREA